MVADNPMQRCSIDKESSGEKEAREHGREPQKQVRTLSIKKDLEAVRGKAAPAAKTASDKCLQEESPS